MDVEQLLTTTRSVRRSLDLSAPVDRADIRECLRIALQAANGSNEQPWRWVCVFDPSLRSRIAELYGDVYRELTGGRAARAPGTDARGRMLDSTAWLVEHLAEVPLLVIPCYRPYMPGADEGASTFRTATVYGSIFPAVWNFQLALHVRGYGTCITTMHLQRRREVGALLGIPDDYVQGCLLPVGKLPPGRVFAPAPRRPIDEVVAVDGWDGPPLTQSA